MSRGKKIPLNNKRSSTGKLPLVAGVDYIDTYPSDDNIKIDYSAKPARNLETAQSWANEDRERWVSNEPLAILEWKKSIYPGHVHGMVITLNKDGGYGPEFVICLDAGDEYTELAGAETYRDAIKIAIEYMNDEPGIKSMVNNIFGSNI